jgi:hypothetical protein
MKKLIIIVACILFGCSSVNIKGINSAPDFSITKYKTFNFFDVDVKGDALGPNYQSNLELLKAAIVKQMELKGLKQDTGNPNLMVNIGVVVSEEIQTRETSFTNPTDRVGYMGQRNYSWQAGEVEVGKYRDGTITLDFVDQASNKLVWQGSAESVIPNKETNVPPLIDSGMEQLFAKIK